MMKYKSLYTVLLTVVILISLSMSKSQKYFEGEIHYTIDYTQKNDISTLENLKKSTGTKMVMLFKEGNWLKKYYNKEGKLLSMRFLDLSEKKSYRWDTQHAGTQWIDITKNDSPTTFSIEGEEMVLEQACTKVTSKTKIDYMGINYEAKAEYHYANGLKTNKSWYEAYAEGNFNEIAKQLNCLILKQSFDAYYYIMNLEATEIIEREITDEEFSFDKTRLPLKQL